MTTQNLPAGYELKRIPSVTDYWFVDGAFGHRASSGETPEEAIANAIKLIDFFMSKPATQRPSWHHKGWLTGNS